MYITTLVEPDMIHTVRRLSLPAIVHQAKTPLQLTSFTIRSRTILFLDDWSSMVALRSPIQLRKFLPGNAAAAPFIENGEKAKRHKAAAVSLHSTGINGYERPFIICTSLAEFTA